MRNPELDKKCMEDLEKLKERPLLPDWVDKWAEEKPEDIAIIEYNTGEQITWKKFATATKAFAAKLLSLGLKKGDIVATTLVLLKEHVYLMYACWRIGVIIAPLDPRLKVEEVDRCFTQMKPKAYVFLGKTPVTDFRPMVEELMKKHSATCKYWIQFQKEPDLIIKGAIGITDFAKDIKKVYLINGMILGKVKKARKLVQKRDPCLIIFTTGSTGYPKPALLCHEAILVQNLSLAVGFEFSAHDKVLVNLPPSHVGCTTEQLATSMFAGATSVLLHLFKPEDSMDAVSKYKINFIGQIPALFSMEWRLPDYNKYDISSLRFALYGGQSVTREFLVKLKEMAPYAGTGLGLTETAGFVTYSPLDGTVDDILASVGFDSPLYPISIRKPMKADGNAGDELKKGEIGEICFSGPQTFNGYLNDEENTRKTVSKDGVLYTGDLGSYDEKGLHFAGRAKYVIKPKGYQVYPPEIEDYLMSKLKDKIQNIAIVGAKHDVFSEGVVCYVEKKPGSNVTIDEVNEASNGMASYKRPSLVILLEPGQMPLNRVAKTDLKTLSEMAKKATEELRKKGGWDK
jgi:fatty-acyl-CoA synthase